MTHFSYDLIRFLISYCFLLYLFSFFFISFSLQINAFLCITMYFWCIRLCWPHGDWLRAARLARIGSFGKYGRQDDLLLLEEKGDKIISDSDDCGIFCWMTESKSWWLRLGGQLQRALYSLASASGLAGPSMGPPCLTQSAQEPL